MARRSQCSSAGDNPLDPNYLPPHYREEYRLAIDALVEEDLEGYYQFLQKADVVDFLCSPEIHYIQGSIQVPQQTAYPEQQQPRFLEDVGDGSSDTYWPLHSDLDVPDLDLGWPQLQRFIGPTEVTTLVNPPEPDMPSIKDQARRLIKNAQQVIAIVMDMFTDVDIFADILNAAMRNVAVYILLDQQDAHHFANMVANCRVNLESIQLLRVRTVSGITYHCRSGKSFKGQMMDRFLLTDCRAVLSGNYSFMWSFEKLHRCMAHLFLGQLVSTFDEEFRILYAQSKPLVMENLLPQLDEYNPLQKRPYPSEKVPLHRDPRKFLSMDVPHTDDWARHSHEERMDMDWRLKPLKRRGSLHGPADMYGRFPPQQSHMDPPFEQGPSRMPMMDNPAWKRHSYAEGGHGRYSYPYMQQQGIQEPENQGRHIHRGQQPYPGQGKEADYSGYDKFWNQDFHADQYPEPSLPPESEPSDFDPVLNYLSSTRNADIDQGSEKLPPATGLPLPSSQPRRLSLGQPYACQTSPTPSNPTDQKEFFQEPNTDRKDPVVKRGLRNWRISSYLSAYDNSGDEGLPMASTNTPDAFEEPSPQMALGVDITVPKISKFKVPAIPRASQMPSYVKPTAREQVKVPDEPSETKTTPTPSDSSSTTDGEKTEEAEQKEPKTSGLQREESFRRKYNVAIPRSSRLRSSLIFSSLDQQQNPQDTKTAPGQEDEESDKNEKKLPFSQRRSAAREPYEWSRYVKSSTVDDSSTNSKPQDGISKENDKDTTKEERSKDHSENPVVQEKPSDVKQETSSPSMPRSKESEAELPKTAQTAQPPASMLSFPFHVDMSNPDQRLMFFKELAAKRKAAKAAEAEKSKEKAPMKPPDNKEESGAKETSENVAATSKSDSSSKNTVAEDVGKAVSTETCKAVGQSSDGSDTTTKKDCQVKSDHSDSQSCKEEQTRVSTEKMEVKNSQSVANLPVPADVQTPQSKSEEEPKLSSPAVTNVSASNQATPTQQTPAIVVTPVEGTDQRKTPSAASSSKESCSAKPSSEDVHAPAHAVLDSNSQDLKSAQLETSISSEQQTGSELSSSQPSEPSSSSDAVLPDACSQSSPSPPSSDISPNVKDSTQTSAVLSPNAKETTSSTTPEPSQLKSSEVSSKVDPKHVESDISLDSCGADSESNISPSKSSTKTDSEESSASKPSDKPDPESESTVPKAAEEGSEVTGSEKDADSTPPRVSTSLNGSCLPGESQSNSGNDQNETPTPFDNASTEHKETSSPVNSDSTPGAAQSDTNVSPQDATIQVTPPSKLDLTGPATPASPQTVSCSSPLVESVGSVLPPEAEKTPAALQSPSDTESFPQQVTTDSNETPVLASTETSSPTEATLQVQKDPHPQSETAESESPELVEKSKIDGQNEVSKKPEVPDPDEKETADTTNEVNKSATQESVCSEKTNDQVGKSNGAEQPEVTSKQPKPVQSRYQSSTANVLSSSNLRDDTKLLLEQISANSQSRNEASKEAPVTDDEKEDEADKNAKREKERGIRSLSRAQPKSNDERDKLLEKLQSMRKERKVYSRFELAP